MTAQERIKIARLRKTLRDLNDTQYSLYQQKTEFEHDGQETTMSRICDEAGFEMNEAIAKVQNAIRFYTRGTEQVGLLD